MAETESTSILGSSTHQTKREEKSNLSGGLKPKFAVDKLPETLESEDMDDYDAFEDALESASVGESEVEVKSGEGEESLADASKEAVTNGQEEPTKLLEVNNNNSNSSTQMIPESKTETPDESFADDTVESIQEDLPDTDSVKIDSPKSEAPKKKLTMQERLAMAVNDKKSKKKKKAKKSLEAEAKTKTVSTVAASDLVEKPNNIEKLEKDDVSVTSDKKEKHGELDKPEKKGQPVAATIDPVDKQDNEPVAKNAPAYATGEVDIEKQQLLDKISKLESSLKKAIENNKKDKKSEEFEKTLKNKDDQIKALMEEGEKLSLKELKLTTIIKNLKAKEQSSQSKTEQLEESLNESKINYDTLQNEYRSLIDKHSKTELTLKKYLKIESNLEDTKQKLEHERQEKLSREADIKKLNLTISDLNNEKRQIKEEFEMEIARLENKIEILRLQSEESKRSTKNDDTGSEAVEKLKKENTMLFTKHQQLQELYDNSIVKINELSESLETAKRNEASQLKNTKKLMDEYNDLKQELNHKQTIVSELEEQIKFSQQELKACKEQITNLQSKYDELYTKHNSTVMSYEDKLKDFEIEKFHALNDSEEKLSTLGASQEDLLADPRFLSTSSQGYPRKSSDIHLPWGQLSRSGSIIQNISGFAKSPIPHDSPLMNDSSSLNFDSQSRFESVSAQNSPFINITSPQIGGSSSGPSVQVIGKLSSKISRLETEMVANREELKKCQRENNNLRDEILEMVKKIEFLETFETENEKLTEELNELKKREKLSLELLGEKSEKVDELTNDVQDLKDLLRQQVEQMIEMQSGK